MRRKIPVQINKAYMPLVDNRDRYLIMYGGGGSGKSHFSAQKLLLRTLHDADLGIKHRFLVLRKTQPSARRSVFSLLKDYNGKFGLDGVCKENKQEMILTYGFGSEIMCGGLDDPDKIKSIEGITGIWMEEATEFTPDDMRQIDLRLRGESGSYKQIMMSFNPISEHHWIRKQFFDAKKESCTVLHTTYRDNRFIDAEYKAMLKRLKTEDPDYYKIYNLGEWGELKNIVYHNYEVVDLAAWPESFDDVYYGLDFGFNNPTALVQIGERDQVVYERELIYESGLTNQDLIAKLRELKIDPSANIYADCAEPARIKEICDANFNAYPANKSVKDGIDYCRRLTVKVHPESDKMIKEYHSYKYKEDKNGESLEEPLKFADHAMDAKRYGEYTHYIERNDGPHIYSLG